MNNNKLLWTEMANVLDPFGGVQKNIYQPLTVTPQIPTPRITVQPQQSERESLVLRAAKGIAHEIPRMGAIYALSIPVRAGLSMLFPAASPLLMGSLVWGATMGTWKALEAAQEEKYKEMPEEFAKGAAEGVLMEIGGRALGKVARKVFNRKFILDKAAKVMGHPTWDDMTRHHYNPLHIYTNLIKKGMNKDKARVISQEYEKLYKIAEKGQGNFSAAFKQIRKGNLKKAVEKLPPAYREEFIKNIQKEASKKGIKIPEFDPTPAPTPKFTDTKVLEVPKEAHPDDIFIGQLENKLATISEAEKKKLIKLGEEAIPKPYRFSSIRKKWASPMWSKHLRGAHDEIHKLYSESNEYTSKILEEAQPYLRLSEASKKKINAKLIEAYHNKMDFTPEKLAKELSPEEIEGYMAYRRALDKGYFEIIPDIMRKAGIPEEEITRFLEKHHREQYFPAMRFGRYVTIVKQGKNVIWNGATDDRKEAAFLHSFFTKNLPKAKVKTIDIHTQEFRYPNAVKELYTVSQHLPDLEKFMASKGIKPQEFEEFKKILDEVTIKKWSEGRFAPRYDIPGFSPDLERALKKWAEAVPRSLNKYFNRGKIYKTLDSVPAIHRAQAREYIDMALGGPKPEPLSTGITSVMYQWYLGFKPVYAVRNFFQRYLTTTGRAVKEAGSLSEGMKACAKAQMDAIQYFEGFWSPQNMWKGNFKDFLRKRVEKIPDEYTKKILTRLIRQEVIAPAIKEEFAPQVEKKIAKEFLKKSSMFIYSSDTSNRLNAALTAINIAKNKGLSINEAVDFARNFVARTQWIYSFYSRPEYLKGVGRPLFLFKYWTDNYLRGLWDLYKHDKRAFMTQMGIFLSLAGTEGIPFLKDAEKAIDAFAKNKGWIEWPAIKNKYRKETPSILREGIPALAGVPGSWQLGMPNILPTEFPPVKLAQQIWHGLESLTNEAIPWEKKLYYFTPTIMKHVLAAVTDANLLPQDYYGKQRYTYEDIRRLPRYLRPEAIKWYKKLPRKWPEHQRVLYALGFSCLQRKEVMDMYRGFKQMQSTASEQKRRYHIAIARALAEKDFEDARELYKAALKQGLELNRDAIKRYYREYKETNK